MKGFLFEVGQGKLCKKAPKLNNLLKSAEKKDENALNPQNITTDLSF